MITDADRDIINHLSVRLAAAEAKIMLLTRLTWAVLIIAIVLCLAAVMIAQE